ncbi:hypothetical protein AB0M36_13905 [Actinoplanes sp. NPDC051346]|uniref:hypothetical protein n=1 Tax=Actinoplanes sp. NPDC051346 TaxID=3155048 RepID=UPI0034149EC8
MSDEYGWPDLPDHHDDPGHHDAPLPDAFTDDGYVDHDDFGHHDAGTADDPHVAHAGVEYDAGGDGHDDPGPDPDPDPGPGPDDVAAAPADVTGGLGPIGADPDAADAGDEPASLFPPIVDVGPLPEPVDGFPWIDTGSLGVVDPAAPVAGTTDPVTPQDLAAYAVEELPPGVDPWAALADSEDPATAALARWWAANG